MKKMIVSALVFVSVTVTGITGFASPSRGGQLARSCESWCRAASECLGGTSFSDAAAVAGKRMLSYQKANVLEKKAALASASAKSDTAAETGTASKTETASAQTAAAPAQTAPASAQTAAVYTDTTAVANQAYCSHGYCVGQCPYSDCPHGGYCANNDGYQYQDNWNDTSYANGGGDTYVYDDSYYGGQTSDYSCYQGYGQGYGCQGGYSQGYSSGHHSGGHGHH